jgi:hypothetical protein
VSRHKSHQNAQPGWIFLKAARAFARLQPVGLHGKGAARRRRILSGEKCPLLHADNPHKHYL